MRSLPYGEHEMHDKKLCKISNVGSGVIENALFADEDVPSVELRDAKLRRCLFVRIRAKQAEILDSSFKHCVFEDCYFKDTHFSDVDFTDSYFRDCNLTKVSFEGCCLWYVRFSRCRVDYERILHAIPSQSSIAVPLLRELRQNALQMGEKNVADKILVKTIEREKEELKAQFWAISDYYRTRFKRTARIKSGAKFVNLTLSGLIWGYGLKLTNLLLSGLFAICVFSALIAKFGLFVKDPNCAVGVKLTSLESFYLSVVTFTTLGYGDFTPASALARLICSIESLFGIVFLGFLAAAVYRKFAR